jgi:hypothetical protein
VGLRRPSLDNRIAQGSKRRDDHALALRKAQLVGTRERQRLARRFTRLLGEGDRLGALCSAAPINRRAVEAAKGELTEFVLTLLSNEKVDPCGVILGRRLLSDPCSSLYTPPGRPVDIDHLRHEALAALFALRRPTDIPAMPTPSDGPADAPGIQPVRERAKGSAR